MNHHGTSGRHLLRSQAPALLAVGGAALPKCPVCLMAVCGAAGLGASLPAGWLPVLTLSSLSLLLGVLAVGAARQHALGPLTLGLAAAAAVLLGKYRLDSNTVVYGGMGLLVAASLWNGWPRTQATGFCTAAGCGRKDPASLQDGL